MLKRLKRWYRKNKGEFWDFVGALMIVGSVPLFYIYVSVLQAFLTGR